MTREQLIAALAAFDRVNLTHNDTVAREDRRLAAMQAALEAVQTQAEAEAGPAYRIDHDGFTGTRQGSYVTREGKRGLMLQQLGTKVVHVYGEKWCVPL